MDLNTKCVRNSEIEFRNIDDEIVMMSVEMGEYFGINPVGSRIWALLETPRTCVEICEVLLEEYDVQSSQCQKELEEFIGKLLDKNLIVETCA